MAFCPRDEWQVVPQDVVWKVGRLGESLSACIPLLSRWPVEAHAQRCRDTPHARATMFA
jgi:hypothetical protein